MRSGVTAGPLDMGTVRREIEEQAKREDTDLATFCERLDAEQIQKREGAKVRMPYFKALAERLTREGIGPCELGQRLMDEGLDPFAAAETAAAARLTFREAPVLLDIPGDTTPGLVH